MIKDNTLNIVIFGLSITSSWGNGHATTYRGLCKELSYRGHDIIFFEKDLSFYATNRDLPNPDFCRVVLYNDLIELDFYKDLIANADLVIVGSYVPNGVQVGNFVLENAKGIKAFYDIDTPVTLSKLENEDYEYLEPSLISKYDMYLSFTGGPTLTFLEEKYLSPHAFPLYCSFDPNYYYPVKQVKKWILGYLGTYSKDRQAALQELLIKPSYEIKKHRFVVAGPQYPEKINWGNNIDRIQHIAPVEHAAFYNKQLFTLNITRTDMIKAGYSPSVRLFEAAACGIPIISDYWKGIESIFKPNEEVFIAKNSEDVINYLMITDDERKKVGNNARENVLINHTAEKRAIQLEDYYQNVFSKKKKLNLIKNNY